MMNQISSGWLDSSIMKMFQKSIFSFHWSHCLKYITEIIQFLKWSLSLQRTQRHWASSLKPTWHSCIVSPMCNILLSWFIVWLKGCKTISTCVSPPTKPPGGLGVDLPSLSTEGALSLPQECERCIMAWRWARSPVGLLLNPCPWLPPLSPLLLLSLPSPGGPPWAEGSLRDRVWSRLLGVSYRSLSRLGIWYSSLCPWDAQELHLEAQEQEEEVAELSSGVSMDWKGDGGGGGGVGGGAEGGEEGGGGGAGKLATEPKSSPPPWLAVSRLPVYEEKLPE